MGNRTPTRPCPPIRSSSAANRNVNRYRTYWSDSDLANPMGSFRSEFGDGRRDLECDDPWIVPEQPAKTSQGPLAGFAIRAVVYRHEVRGKSIPKWTPSLDGRRGPSDLRIAFLFAFAPSSLVGRARPRALLAARPDGIDVRATDSPASNPAATRSRVWPDRHFSSRLVREHLEHRQRSTDLHREPVPPLSLAGSEPRAFGDRDEDLCAQERLASEMADRQCKRLHEPLLSRNDRCRARWVGGLSAVASSARSLNRSTSIAFPSTAPTSAWTSWSPDTGRRRSDSWRMKLPWLRRNGNGRGHRR